MLKSLSVVLRYWFSKQKDLIKNNQPYKSPIWYGCIIPWYMLGMGGMIIQLICLTFCLYNWFC
jgi:hypothetical protein